jgi:magnesium transporter
MSKRIKKIGLPPGSLVFTGNRKVENVEIHHIQYDHETLVERVIVHQDIAFEHQESKGKIEWYDTRGIHDTSLTEQMGQVFSIHPLILEDIVDIHQRVKFEEYETGVSIIIKALAFDKHTLKVTKEQVAIFFKEGIILSFQETESDLFEEVRKRLKRSSGRIRHRGADYLAYALIDVIVDNYYLVLDEIGDQIELLEDSMLSNEQHSNTRSEIHNLKKELLLIRKMIAPLREAMSRFSKTDSPFIVEDTMIFTRDLYDHTIQVMDTVESFRDLLNGLQDLLISEINFKMNQVMQMLTLVSMVFIPLSFLVGVYGMNFEYMPELQWKYSYLILWIIMVVIFAGLLFYFKKKKWI